VRSVAAFGKEENIRTRPAAYVQHIPTFRQEALRDGELDGGARSGLEPRELVVGGFLIRRTPLGTMRRGTPSLCSSPFPLPSIYHGEFTGTGTYAIRRTS
jgi:hypothetical protein